MWKLSKFFFFCIALGAFLAACNKQKSKEFTAHPLGYYYKLLSYESENNLNQNDGVVQLAVTFSNQNDSVFWDSYNNLNSAFFIKPDTSSKTEFLRNYVSQSALQDSFCLLLKPADFYRQHFQQSSIPYFSKNDTIVKIHVKVLRFLSAKEFSHWQQKARKDEEDQIRNFFGTDEAYNAARDVRGFYWVKKPTDGQLIAFGFHDELTISYEGHFLNGRFLEKSPPKFELLYGVPDQLLKGLNYVIEYLKKGEDAKIILPSPLAFGENGSSNGTVPPFTPILYNVKLIDFKRNEKK